MIITKTNRILIVWATLSTFSILGMEKSPEKELAILTEAHIVTIYNMLVQSAISVNRPIKYDINGKSEIHYSSTEVKPRSVQEFAQLTQNNTSNLKILLPYCYNQRSIDINVTKNREAIYVLPGGKGERCVQISNTSGEKLAVIESLMKPVHYHRAKSLMLKELVESIKPHHNVTINNLSKIPVTIIYEMNVYKEKPSQQLTAKNIATFKTIKSETQRTVSIISKNGQALLEFSLPHCNTAIFTVALNENQKNLTIKHGSVNFDEVGIEDETQQVIAWTYILPQYKFI